MQRALMSEPTVRETSSMFGAGILLATIGATWSVMLIAVVLASPSAAAGALVTALSLPWLAATWALASGPATAWARSRRLQLARTGRAAVRPVRTLAASGAFRIW